jgi:hypothetical protein
MDCDRFNITKLSFTLQREAIYFGQNLEGPDDGV